MEELLAAVARLTETVNRMEAMMLEDRKEKAENKIIAKERAQEFVTCRIVLFKKYRDEKIKAMERLNVKDEYYESDKQEYQKGQL